MDTGTSTKTQISVVDSVASPITTLTIMHICVRVDDDVHKICTQGTQHIRLLLSTPLTENLKKKARKKNDIS